MSLSGSSDSSQEKSVISGQRPNSSPSPLLETFCYTCTAPSPYWTPFCSPTASQRANWRTVCFLREESHCSKTEERKSKDKAGWDTMDVWCGLTERQWEREKEGQNVLARGDKRSRNAPTSSDCPTDWVFIVTPVIWKRETFGGHSHALGRVTNAKQHP